MAIPVRIDELLYPHAVESSRIEFKADFNPEPVVRTICAFANDIDNLGGGYIIIGVEERDGNPVFPLLGLEASRIDGILKKLHQYCHYIEPLYEPVAEPVLYHDMTDGKDKYVIVLWISGGYGRPYKAPKDVTAKNSGKYYFIRKFSSTVIASPEEEKELFYVSSSIPFDDRENLAADVSDIDIALLRNHLKEIGSDLYALSEKMDVLELAKDMQLVSGPEERLKPLNVAILMFCEHPEKYFRYARIEVVDIPDPTGSNMTEKIFTGPIQRQLKDALAYIKNYVLKEMVVKSPESEEALRVFNYPFAAVEEILSNAVYHRSYQLHEPITVRISPSSMEITSFPGFDRSISDEDISRYDMRARIYRNRRIGDFLKELHLIEGRNTGFPNAFKALRENGSALPQFKMNPERDYLSVIIPVQERFLQARSVSTKLLEYENTIIAAVKETPLSLTEIAIALGYKGISKKLSETVRRLESLGRLKPVLPDEAKTVKYTAAHI